MKYLLALSLFGLIALLPACGNGDSKTASSQMKCCDSPHCKCPATSGSTDCCSTHSCACRAAEQKKSAPAEKESSSEASKEKLAD